MPDIFDEVEEDLRAERARGLLARFGGAFAGLLVLVLVGVGGYEGWRWWQGRAAGHAAEAYLAAGQAAAQPGSDAKAAAQRYEQVAASAPEGYRILARLRAAALKAEAGDRAGALADYDAIARDNSADPLYRDLASLLWGMHAVDGGDPALIEARLAALSNGPWRAGADEIRALAALRRGDTEAARRLLTALSNDPLAPQGSRDRAGRLLAGLGS